MSEISERKQAHIDLCLLDESQGSGDLFADYALPYKALPEVDLADVDISTELLGKKLSQPLIMSSMTGGVAHAKTINTNLAIAAEETGVAMGVGSQRIALELDEAKDTFQLVRTYAPTAVIFANMGAVQLNYGRTVEDYQRVIDMIHADALYLHLNPLQEAIQLEGDTDFSGLVKKIENLVKAISVPVFVKEVGHGIDLETAKKLCDLGVKGIDAAGVGGTSWAWVEAKRAEDEHMQTWFKAIGYRTDELLEQYSELPEHIIKVASGGLRTPIEAVKAGALRADFYAMAQPFLAPALESDKAVINFIHQFEKGVRIALFSTGQKKWGDRGKIRLYKR